MVRYDNKLLKQISTLENNIQTLEDNITRDTRGAMDLLSDINQIKQIIEKNNEISDNYSMVSSTINSKNKKILADYENNIRILNEGKINITQQPDETEQAYGLGRDVFGGLVVCVQVVCVVLVAIKL